MESLGRAELLSMLRFGCDRIFQVEKRVFFFWSGHLGSCTVRLLHG